MKLVIVVVFFAVVQGGNLFAQRIIAGMSQEEVRSLFPSYAQQIPDTNDIMAFDSIAHFKFHGVYGTAYFDFCSIDFIFLYGPIQKDTIGVSMSGLRFLLRVATKRL